VAQDALMADGCRRPTYKWVLVRRAYFPFLIVPEFDVDQIKEPDRYRLSPGCLGRWLQIMVWLLGHVAAEVTDPNSVFMHGLAIVSALFLSGKPHPCSW
jgi:hypothetical protein